MAEIRQLAVGRFDQRHVLEFQLLDHVGDPAFAERFPGEHRDRARAEQRPQRHLDRAGVGSRHDADTEFRRNLQNFSGEIDRPLELRAARLGAVRAGEKRVGEDLQAPAWALGAGTGGEVRDDRPHAGHCARHSLSFQIEASRWGEVARRRN